MSISSRLTVDIPAELHKTFKIEAATEGVNIKTLVINAMECYLERKPNKETIATFEKTDRGEELHEILDIDAYFESIRNQVQKVSKK